MQRKNLYSLLAEYSSIIFVLPSSLLVGYLIGEWLDRRWGTFPWLSMLFLLLGGGAGFLQVFRILNRKRRP
ncbi:MAG: AtpZ/AtpI family protein [Acidobacteria bacterium]|nr:AtpZ/AtpI family protein [Acidobacteriota bacterium]